jgi:hypothetical protein
MTYAKIFLCCLILCVLGITGCSSNTTSSSGYGQGTGYNISLRTTQALLPQGGSSILIATVKDNQGNPINDSSGGVLFTSTQGATIVKDVDSINLGVCNATYTAPSTTAANVVVDQVTASYQGAFAFVSIEVYKQ